MDQRKKTSFLVVGLALFSMFFGSGNLIFPLFVGEVAANSLAATVGFLSTAVLLPFLGVLAMVIFKGDYPRFFELLGRKMGFFLAAVLLTIWIPLGSGPRCIAVAHGGLSTYMTLPSLWVFSIFYTGLVYLVIRKKSGIVDILGKLLTPLLLACLAILFFRGIQWPSFSEAPFAESFFFGLKEGYNTMDMIAAFFFSASVIGILQVKASHPIRTAMKASVVGTCLLGLVYVGLIQLAGQNIPLLEGVPKEQLLAHIAKVKLGAQLGMISVVAIVLACFTTSVALTLVFYEFLMRTKLPWISTRDGAIGTTLGIGYVMSIFGLQGITFVTAPILRVCYPLLLGMIVIQVAKAGVQTWQEGRLANQ